MSTNLYRQMRELLPEPPLLVATVAAVNGDETSVVEYPGGSQQRVRGSGYSVAAQVFVRNGVIESAAPALTAVTIEV